MTDLYVLISILFVVCIFCGILNSIFEEMKKENTKKHKSGKFSINTLVDDKLILLMERFELAELDVKVTSKNLIFLEDDKEIARIITDRMSEYPYGSFRDGMYYNTAMKGKPSLKIQFKIMLFRRKLENQVRSYKTNNIVTNKKVEKPEVIKVQL